MPLVDPRSSFEVAAAHLFRHLHEPRHLKKNPLVQRFFRDRASGRFFHAQERVALERIHEVVREAARSCRQAEEAACEHERALRQHTIVTLNLLERRPLAEVARTLGISTRQSYRERTEVCVRLARRIRDAAETPAAAVVLDASDFRLRHAEFLAQLGDVAGALREYDQLAANAPPRQRIAALCESASISAWSAQLGAATRSLSTARKVFVAEAHSMTQGDRQGRQANIDLAAAQLARSSGRYSEALEILTEARARLEPFESGATDDLKEMYVRILVACSTNGVWHSGDFSGSVTSLSKAHAILAQIAAPSPHLGVEVALRLCRRRNDMATNAHVWQPVPERFAALSNAFERARVSGSLALSLYGCICLMIHHSGTGNAAALGDDIRYALAVMRQAPREGHFGSMPYDIAEILLRTKYWKYARVILATAKGPSGGTTHPEGIDYVRATCYLRSGMYRHAWELASAPRDGDLSPHILANMKIVGAVSADALGKRHQARDLIQAAIAALERAGCAPDLRAAYSVAAEITGETRYRRTAEEIGHALGA
jgi:tetratricopeptide (TPR) repeat protein